MFTAFRVAVCLAALSVLAFADEPQTPSSNTLHFRGTEIELNYPENWQAAENSGFVYLTPPAGFVDGLISHGMLIGTFDPDGPITLADASDEVVHQYRRWNQNITLVRYHGETRIAGLAAKVFDMMNESPAPAHGMENDQIVTVVRPNGLVTYFVAIVPDRDLKDYKPAFDRILSSVRFLN